MSLPPVAFGTNVFQRLSEEADLRKVRLIDLFRQVRCWDVGASARLQSCLVFLVAAMPVVDLFLVSNAEYRSTLPGSGGNDHMPCLTLTLGILNVIYNLIASYHLEIVYLRPFHV